MKNKILKKIFDDSLKLLQKKYKCPIIIADDVDDFHGIYVHTGEKVLKIEIKEVDNEL